MGDFVWYMLLALIARAVFLRWTPATQLHDPISALIAGVVDAVASVPEAIGLGTLATAAPEAAGAGLAGFGEAALAAPELAAGTAGAGLAAAAPEVVGAGLAGFGAEALAPELALTTGLTAPLEAGSTALSAAEGLSTPLAGAASPTIAATTPLASIPSVAPTPSFVTAAADLSPGFSASGDVFLPNAAQLAEGPLTPVSFTGPAAGATTAAPVEIPATDLGLSPGAGAVAMDASGNITATSGDLSTFGGAVGPGTAEGGAAGGGGGGILSKLGLGGVSEFFKENKDLLTLGSVGASLLPLLTRNLGPSGIIKTPTAASETGLASNLTATSEALSSAALTGQLPAGYENALQRAKDAAAARIRGAYARMGGSGSTSEAEDLAASAAQIEGERATLLQSLTTQGINAGSTAGNQNIQLIQQQVAQDEELQKALQALASNMLLSSVPVRLATV